MPAKKTKLGAPPTPETLGLVLEVQGDLSKPKAPKAADWSQARFLMDRIKTAIRLSLTGQILLGRELQTIKKELGFSGSGGDRRSKGRAVHLIEGPRTWDDWTQAELGISYKTADRMIASFEAAQKRLERLGGGNQRLIGLMSSSPADMNEADHKDLSDLVHKLDWGESQKELLEELKIVKKHDSSGIGGDTSMHRKSKLGPQVAQQLALAFFRAVPETVAKIEKNIGNLRLCPDYQAFLHVLPLASSSPGEVSLSSLETALETAIQGDLSKVLEEVRAAKAARIKGREAASGKRKRA